jgi:branched-chain amino acid transport system permease protein
MRRPPRLPPRIAWRQGTVLRSPDPLRDVPDPSFVFAQSISGLTAAMFLFLIASGLSLIFGVLRVLNFAHGTFYMLGAYSAYQLVQWLGVDGGRFWLAALGAATAIAVLGGLVERLLFRHLYGKEELYQLLFTYALVLILSDAAKMIWGTQQKSVSRPPGLTGSFTLFGATIPDYNLFILLLGPAIALAVWFVLQRTRVGRFIRAAALDRETLGALGVNVNALYTWVFVIASFLGGLGGALISPMRATTPGMDTEIIVEAFVVVVIGGLGSFWGTFLGALIYGQVLSFGILFFPRFSIFAVFALMAGVLVVRPWGLLGRPLK